MGKLIERIWWDSNVEKKSATDVKNFDGGQLKNLVKVQEIWLINKRRLWRTSYHEGHSCRGSGNGTHESIKCYTSEKNSCMRARIKYYYL